MATSMASDKSSAASAAGVASGDPFMSTTSGSNHYRFSQFDSQLFALGPGASAEQAKRALQSHLAETERRMEEAGKLGTSLVQQQKELTERLKEVEQLEAEEELTPELKQRLVGIEKDYNEVARESARAFLPKQRVPSNEAAAGSPFAPEGKGGRRSVSPSKFESQATGSPTKLSVPNRKIRNQPTNRVHDIEFAAEISTSLIAQVRNLQQLLAEREEELRDTKAENSKLEIETEGLQQRMKNLDDSENRYKDENWNLETQIHDLIAAQKEAADREKKLAQSLSVLRAEKNSTQRELDELKMNHSKLAEEHAATVKHNDIELGTAKRNAVMAESERAAMQRKIEDLTSQNQELARAFSTQRGRTLDREHLSGMSDEDFETATDNATPEHSPPPSPVKNTPRHSMLESETMKTSLLHAQRTIQSLRTNIHREKTEKLELKRILQEARDELEKFRADPTAQSSKRNRKVDSREFKKGKIGQLGGLRNSRSEVFLDDPNWEDNGDAAGTGLSPFASPSSHDFNREVEPIAESSDHFETANEANETSDAAFESARERATETDDFHTGAEEFSDDDDAATETESPSRGANRMRRPPILPMNHASSRYSFHSTASTSADEEDYTLTSTELRTPTAAPLQRTRLRVMSRGTPSSRRSRQASEEPQLMSSPVTIGSSVSGTPQQPAQSLFAELGDFDSDDESYRGISSRRSIRSLTPGSIRGRTTSPPPEVPMLPKVIMVDSGMVTDPVFVQSFPLPLGNTEDRPVSVQSVVGPAVVGASAAGLAIPRDMGPSRLLSTYSDAGAQHDPEMEEKLAQLSAPPTQIGNTSTPNLPPPQTLSLSAIGSECVEPLAEPEILPPAPNLSLSGIVSEHIEPVSEPDPLPPPPALSISTLGFEHVEPVVEPVAEPEALPPPPPALSISTLGFEHVEPVAELDILPPPPPVLSLSNIISEHVEPVAQSEIPASPPPVLSYSGIHSEQVDPQPEPEIGSPPAPVFTFSKIVGERVEPVAEPEILQAPPPPTPVFTLSRIVAESVEPVAEPEPLATPPIILAFSPIATEHVVPIAEPEPEAMARITLSYSTINSQHIEPTAEPEQPTPTPSPLSYSTIVNQHVEPIAEARAPSPSFTFSPLTVEQVVPISVPEAEPVTPALGFAMIQSINTEPIEAASPKRNAFIIPRDDYERDNAVQPRTPTQSFTNIFGRNKAKGKTQASPIIAEDETRQSPSDSPMSETPESQRPFKEISTNSNFKPVRKAQAATLDRGAQTALTADTIDQLLKTGSRSAVPSHQKSESLTGSIISMSTPGTVRIRRSQESLNSVIRHKGRSGENDAPVRRPNSAASGRLSSQQGMPPLPPNHKEVIEAARSGSASGPPEAMGSMGPPLYPASALRNQQLRPRTPTSIRPMSPASGRGTPTPRAARLGSALGHPDMNSPRLTARSRQSSVSSFASEVDARFNMGDNTGMGPVGFGPNTDPRMIQAITQTMIGEYLWKYTRKAGRGEMSGNRHRRYFWVHPYTRTLYWSDSDPSTAGRAELKAKSVPIEAVRVVTDDNPMPPGLHRKSLVVISPGRTIKFTCTTGQRHETWFNSLSYLLVRTTDDTQADTEEMAGHITREDVDEFNPPYGRQSAAGNRSRGTPSLSSYNTRTARDESPAMGMSMNIPTLTPTSKKPTPVGRQSTGTLGRISGYWKSSQLGTFSTRRSRSAVGREQQGIYDASEAHDSAEDLRMIYEQQDREADRLENVRACCDGRHDVGTLSHGKNGRHAHGHAHTHPGQSATSTPVSTVRSRA